MPNLAANALVEAHERTLADWEAEKPSLVPELAPPVRTEPVYEPLTPTKTERTFYRERQARIHALPRFRLREVKAVREAHARPHAYRAVLEDTRRMAEVSGRVADILRGTIDWPADRIAFAREEVPAQLPPWGWEARSSDRRGEPESVIDLLSGPSIATAAANRGVDLHVLYRALAELQRRLYGALPTIARDRGVERYVATHLVIAGDAEFLADALPTYDERVRAAAARVHERSSPYAGVGTGMPLLVACAPADVRRAHRIEREGSDDCGERKGSPCVRRD